MDAPVTGVGARPVGRDALLLTCDGPSQVRSVARAAAERRDRGDLRCDEVVPGATTVLLDGVVDRDAVASGVSRWQLPEPDREDERAVELAVTWDGPDLEEVAGLTGLAASVVVDLLREADLRVAFCGFAPGFAYLAGLPATLHVPRRDTPRTRVPAGSVGLAGEFCGVYPRESPGGWQLVGRTDASLWDLSREEPALLRPGTAVRLTGA